MISSADFIHLPYTSDLTEGGIALALRSLAHTYEREGKSPYGRLRRLVASTAVEVAFRRYLSQENIPFEVKASTPFTDRERFDVVLKGHRCDIKSFLISHREQILNIRKSPNTLLEAQALVPSDSHAGDGHSYDDNYLFAFVNGLVALSQTDMQKVLAKRQPHYLMHVLPMNWRRPNYWKPLGSVIVESASDEELLLEVYGQDEGREVKRAVISISPHGRASIPESFYAITALHVRRVPDAKVTIQLESGESHTIPPYEWANIWVYGMDIFLTGYASYEEMSQRATLLPPGARTFQYEHTHVKNLSLPVAKLKPLKKLF
ncbi:MAG: hypothetical protein H6635_17215 [Anaerolineales bacterium]|nr:hypothetical protein [Anaerolineales bacterium]MCB9147103.1 hypothetical protein [Anaerolineales bacterium]